MKPELSPASLELARAICTALFGRHHVLDTDVHTIAAIVDKALAKERTK